VDLWLTDPVTQAYKICLETSSKRLQDSLVSGEQIDPSNNDLSMNQIHTSIGWKGAVDAMSLFDSVLKQAEMIEVPKNEK